MISSSNVRLSSLKQVRGNETLANLPRLTESTQADDPDTMHALLGTVQVVRKTETLAYPPYTVHQNTVVFVERSSATDSRPEVIACRALCLNTSWFNNDVCLLITHWRYIERPSGLSGEHSESLSHIEILSSPLLVPATISVPESDRDFSWWTQQRTCPSYDLEEQFTQTMRTTALSSGNRAKEALVDRRQTQTMSLCGRITAISTLINASDENKCVFIIDLSVDTRPPTSLGYNEHVVCIPVAFTSARYLGLFACAQIGDALVVSHVRPFTLTTEDGSAQAVFATTCASLAFRVDELTGLSDSQLHVSHTQTTAPSQSSQAFGSQHSRGSTQGFSACASPGAAAVCAASDDARLVSGRGVESYEGVVTRMLDMTLGVYVLDDSHVAVLAYWARFSPAYVLRPGTRVLLENVHVALLSNTSGYSWSWLARVFSDSMDAADGGARRMLVFGACARSSVRITGFAAHGEPGSARVLLDVQAAGVLASRAGGVVRLIEAAEAYWKLGDKFPHGPVASQANREAPGQLMEMALAWTGVTQRPRRLTLEFLRHAKHCPADRPAGARRLRTLKSVLRLFAAFWDARRTARRTADGGQPSAEVTTLSASPADLGLQNTPLVGRLVVSERGQVFLWDGTAHVLVHPSFGAAGRASADAPLPLFPGQLLVGHVYSWNSWRLVAECVDVASISRLRTEPREARYFELAYAAVSSPALLHADATFGGLPVHRLPPPDAQSTQPAQCFVFLVHWREAVGPRPPDLPAAGDKRLLADTTPWKSHILVHGVALHIGLDAYRRHMESAEDQQKVRVSFDLARGSPERCVVRYAPEKVPAVFVPGSAFVLCVRGEQTFRLRDAQEGGVLGVRVGSRDHVRPVHVVVGGRHVSTSPLHMTRHLPVPTISIAAADSAGLADRLGPPHACSVAEVLAMPERGGGAGTLVCVHGTVVQRKINGVVEFLTAPAKNTTAGLVSGMLDTQLLLASESDLTNTVLVYLKLHTYAHPPGVLPGAQVVLRNVALGVAKATDNAYLTSTMLTTIEHVEYPTAPSDAAASVGYFDPSVAPVRCCIGELYGRHSAQHSDELSARRFSLVCRVAALEQLSVQAECPTCGLVLRDASCQCLGTRSTDTPVRAHVEALFRVTDGSGIARMLVCTPSDLSHALALLPDDLQLMYNAAARSWAGRVVWTRKKSPQNMDAAEPDRRVLGGEREGVDAGFGALVERVAARMPSAALLVEGCLAPPVQAEQQVTEQQTLRLDGLTVDVTKHPVPKFIATNVARMNAMETCLRLLDKSLPLL
ncbi:hypothetical protein GGI05_001051 [Coemansia sp. RSA 2603]|nr:hypothetical protein GGI05_001051 [Coemansia sp. RSA 2603]